MIARQIGGNQRQTGFEGEADEGGVVRPLPPSCIKTACRANPFSITSGFGNGVVQRRLLFTIKLFHCQGGAAAGADQNCDDVQAHAVMGAVVMDFAKQYVAGVEQAIFKFGF